MAERTLLTPEAIGLLCAQNPPAVDPYALIHDLAYQIAVLARHIEGMEKDLAVMRQTIGNLAKDMGDVRMS